MSRKDRRGHDLREKFPGFLWIERRLIPREELTMLVGHDGFGKSTFALQMAAEMTTGEFSGQVETVFLSMQEDGEEVTKARLKVYGANFNQLVFQPELENGEPDIPWGFPEDLDVFEEYLRETKCTVAILDSMDAHISALASQSARKTLHLLRAIGKRRGVTFIFVHHVNKSAKSFDQAIGGGRGVKAAMRCTLVWGERPKTMKEIIMGMFAPDDEDDDDDDRKFESTSHALAVHKNSYGKRFPEYRTMLYDFEEIENPYDEEHEHTILKFNYSEDTPIVSPTSIWEARAKEIAGERGAQKLKDTAKRLILQTLADYKDGEWMPGTELLEKVMGLSGAGQHTVENARRELSKNGEIELRNFKNPTWTGWRIKFDIPDAPPDK